MSNIEGARVPEEEGMREYPILYTGQMVRQILAGCKTETRRIVQSPAKNMQKAGMDVIKYRPPGDPWYKDYVWSMRGSTGVWGDYTHEQFLGKCPYGVPGDRLWVRETWAAFTHQNHETGECDELECAPRDMPDRHGTTQDDVVYAADNNARADRWWPSIHMPRWACRLFLDVVSVRVERLQDITEAGAIAEGLASIEEYRKLWDSLAPVGSRWFDNPWVWVVGFKVALEEIK